MRDAIGEDELPYGPFPRGHVKTEALRSRDEQSAGEYGPATDGALAIEARLLPVARPKLDRLLRLVKLEERPASLTRRAIDETGAPPVGWCDCDGDVATGSDADENLHRRVAVRPAFEYDLRTPAGSLRQAS
jgi:hypothetical protein